MKESALWTQLRTKVLGVFWSRIESSAGGGIFDVNGMAEGGREAWIELKIMKGNRLEFQKTQVAWALRRLSMGAKNLFVIARKDNDLYVFHGSVTQRVPSKVYEKTVSIAPKDEDIICIYRKPFAWDDLKETVFGANKRRIQGE